MPALDHLWNGWRSAYVRSHDEGELKRAPRSVFVDILESGLSDEETHIVHRGRLVFAIMNAYPYASGHLLVLPYREVADLHDLTSAESIELWDAVTTATIVLKKTHAPHAMNVGINLGPSAGGSISRHLHVHVVPRWEGDANFMTAVANTRTLPEPLSESAGRIRDEWSRSTGQGQ